MRRRSVLLLLLALACLVVAPVVHASDGNWRVFVLVAYDEEWHTIANILYGYTAEELALVLIHSINDRFYIFDIYFSPAEYTFWDSADDPESYNEMMDEVLAETNFNNQGYKWVLIAFTGQGIPGAWGVCDWAYGAVLVEHAYLNGVGQATDNILQHELSHLYDAPDHDEADLDCVMNNYDYWIGFPWYYKVPTALVTANWCDDCKTVINENNDWWGSWQEGGSGGGGGTIDLYPVKH